jgi:hypothetical protein
VIFILRERAVLLPITIIMSIAFITLEVAVSVSGFR